MRVNADFLVLGSGIAGLSFALKAAEFGQVAVITKGDPSEGATRYAQGGIASVFSREDSFESHIQDTVESGDGLCNQNIVDITVREGPERVRELIDLGVPFTKKEGQSDIQDFPFHLTREGGHKANRILHASDFTGQAIESTLLKAAECHPNIKIYDHHIAIDLITAPKKMRCLGVYALDSKKKQIHTFSAPFTVLATGGAGKVYLYTSNPNTATGDGIAIAHRAGARVSNLEFMQFHPTSLYHPKAKSFLISEALRGEGGELVDSQGRAFAKKYHPMGSLAPRDIVARAIDSEMKRTGAPCVFLDMRMKPSDFLIKRFPNIYSRCLEFGIDLTKEPIPVVPAAHYTCGGVLTDAWGESTVENLFAIGETACTGLHGANRLASNSLLEGVVFSHRAIERVRERLLRMKGSLSRASQSEYMPEHLPEWDTGMAVPMEERITIEHTWREIRTVMWNFVGIVRTDRRLEKALSRIELIDHEVQEYYWKYILTPDLVELRNLVTVAKLTIQCALMRKESRGLHYNLDHPNRDDRFYLKDTII